jgi:serine/threonine protein kinase
MVNQILGDFYEIERQIAKKAGRKTLLCRDLRSLELVVVKLVSFNSDFEWDDLKLFEREAETLKSLSHSAIPQYLDYFELESDRTKSFALVQTYIPAKSLQEHLQAGRSFSEAEVKELATALLEILIYLHDRKPAVIHRDLKPSNVLLGDRTGNSIGQVYLVDFGSVHTLAAKEDGTITVVGTYGYMPPEQFGGRTVPASDIYSLGATLIGLLTGTHPADLPQLDGCIQFAESVNINRHFALWLHRTIQPSLNKRFTSAQEALQVLEIPQINENLLVASKPPKSKVILNKDINSLEIVIPSAGFSLGFLFSLGFAMVWHPFLVVWVSMALYAPFPSNVFAILFILPFSLPGIKILWSILRDAFGQIQLSLNRQQICLTNKLFGFKYNHQRAGLREDITKLEYTKEGCELDSRGVRMYMPPQINILAGLSTFSLSTNELTLAELDWLANELSQWLEIPIDYK